jgi:RNA polymerase sigma factor (sigma-70 family)
MTPRLSLAHARTQRSFETLYHEHVTDVYRYALAVTGQTSDAEDVTQTTFMNAYRAYARGERPRKPQNWLLTIAHNVCRQRARLGYYRVREVELEESAAAAFMPPEDVPTAADIKRALAHLPFQQRAVLIMRELEGRTHAEIAEVMGLTTPATEMLAFRARRALREHLADSLTCKEATTALDRQMAGTLDEESAGLLRAHLRECPDCDQLARRMRAQQSALKSFVVVPLPSSLYALNQASIFAGGGAAAGGAGVGTVVAKFAAAMIAGATIGSGAYLVKRDVPPLHPHPTPARAAHVHRHATTHVVASPGGWEAGPVTGTRATVPERTPVRHKAPKKPAKPSEPTPVVTVPAVPTGASTLPTPPPDDAPVASTEQSVQTDQPVQTDQAVPTADQQPPPGDSTQTPTPTPAPQHDNNGVRAHGSPTPPAQPNGNGPQGKSNATPPPYSSGG